MASLDIAEKRLPQDGRIALKLGDKQVDVRMSTLPTGAGERVVLRLLDKDSARLDLAALGMGEATRDVIDRLIREPHGIVLVTGPTGSGKTTTLYAALSRLPRGSVNMMTVEDPIEYALDGVAQTQVNPHIELDFARALRAILRQDPDVIMIGEIRDLETAQIAVQASLTGHLVLATLHTNDATSAVTRLADMGVEPYLLASSLLGVLAQRLVRTLCPACRVSHAPSAGESKLNAVAWARARTAGLDGAGLRRLQPDRASRSYRRLRTAARRRRDSPQHPRRRRRTRAARGGHARWHALAARRRRALDRRRFGVARRTAARDARRLTRRLAPRVTVPAMSAFRWEAVDAQGRVRQGVLEADSARAARDQLRAEGLTPTAVDGSGGARGPAGMHARLPAPLVTLTTRQLATLVQSGMPLDQALAAVAEQADDARAAKIVAALRTHVASGESLARGTRAVSAHVLAAVSRPGRRGRRNRTTGGRPGRVWPTTSRRARRCGRRSCSRSSIRRSSPSSPSRSSPCCSPTSCRRWCRSTSRAGRRCRGSRRR